MIKMVQVPHLIKSDNIKEEIDMSILPIKRKCQVCGKSFSFNPDVGKIDCPHCGTLLGAKTGDLTELEKRKSVKEEKKDWDVRVI